MTDVKTIPTTATSGPFGTDRRLSLLFGTGVLVMATGGLLWPKLMAPVLGILTILAIGAALGQTGRLPRPNIPIAILTSSLGLWIAASTQWSLEPDTAWDRVARLAPFLALLPFLFCTSVVALLRAVQPSLPCILLVGLLFVCPIVILDNFADFPVYRFIYGRTDAEWMRPEIYSNSVHNRAVSYFGILAWAAAGWAWASWRPWTAVGMIVAAWAMVLSGASNTAGIALGIACAVFAVARVSIRAAQVVVAAGVIGMTLAPPLLFPVLLDLSSPYLAKLPYSAQHRLEIYDFTSRTAAERPLLGWGIGASRNLPVNEEDMPRYHAFDLAPTHPHNAFVQGWVELGIPGVLFLVAFAALVLINISSLPDKYLPFAYASYSGAFVVANLSYSVWSGSWLAAMLLGGMIFVAMPQSPASTRQP